MQPVVYVQSTVSNAVQRIRCASKAVPLGVQTACAWAVSHGLCLGDALPAGGCSCVVFFLCVCV